MKAYPSEPLTGDKADARLEALGLTRASLLATADTALAAGRDVSPFALKMAPGMNRYLVGGESLRGEHVGDRWEPYRRGNLEGIISRDGQTIVYFQNAISCCQLHLPQPRSKRGPQSEKMSSINLFEATGIHLPHLIKGREMSCAAVYYLLVDDDGRVELSSMVIEGGFFTSYGERIILRADSDLDPAVILPEEAPAPVLEIAISRK
ncbi:MAG: hypothetical protein Q4G24_13985 [Paracoccus sp. (in: a-proteobacteria)]|uniref:hypothetical protein n=1 Tax=Paracoccus sp. TaxID=267 RepID=UPI0026DEE541|nr:hypothetical protein [Paracoccus sp. (in: a-proteobacteria)]MDO5622568.1 hypothetical protein [Paracoccus sp. (in: a-proteobacteria)]